MKKKILIIDDFIPLLDEVSEFLSLEGYKVYTAKNGAEGVQKAIQYTPDLILCDIEMPIMNGYDVYRTLEKIPDTSATPVVFLTAKATPQDFRFGLSLGVDDYITKPFTIEELTATINKRIEKREKNYKIANDKFASFAENPIIGMYIYLNDKFIFINEKLTKIIGYDLDEINSIDIFNIIIDDKEIIKKDFNNCYKGQKKNIYREMQILNKNKKPVLLEFFAKHIEINGKNAIVGGVLDISLKKQPSRNINHNKIKEVLKFLTEEDKLIVERAMQSSGNSKEQLEYKEKQIIDKIGLSKRELEVLKLICNGYTNTEIAEQLFLSKRTIDRHRANIMDKTNSSNTAKLVGFAVKYHLVDL